MKHFASEAWADFARGTAAKEQELLMQRHLDDGCGKCAEQAGLWRKVYAAAQRQRLAVPPPESSVRTVKGMYAIHGERTAKRVRGVIAGSLFDSFSAPLAAGVRSTGSSPRQLLYGAGDHRIDVRIEPQTDSDKVTLVGQILDSANPDRELGEASVALVKGRKILASAATNRFGEFHLRCDMDNRLELRVTLPQGREVSVSLIDPLPAASADSLELTDSMGVKGILKDIRKSTRKKG
jgi:hypothetical protein